MQVCVGIRIPHFFKWSFDDPHDAKRYETWRYGACDEVASRDSDFFNTELLSKVPSDFPSILIHKREGDYGYSSDESDSLFNPANKWALDYNIGFSKMAELPVTCGKYEIPLNGKCWKRIIRDTMVAEGVFRRNVYSKRMLYMPLTRNDYPTCTPITEGRWEKTYTPIGEPQRYVWREYPVMGNVLVCDNILLRSVGVIQLKYKRLPCQVMSKYNINGVEVNMGPMDTNAALMDAKFERKGRNVWAFDNETLITLDEARALCGSLKHKFYDDAPGAFTSDCGVDVTEQPFCRGSMDCPYPGTIHEAFRTFTCTRTPAAAFGYNIPYPFGPEGSVRPGDVCDLSDYNVPNGLIFRDPYTGWPKGFCPVVLELARKCVGADAHISADGRVFRAAGR